MPAGTEFVNLPQAEEERWGLKVLTFPEYWGTNCVIGVCSSTPNRLQSLWPQSFITSTSRSLPHNFLELVTSSCSWTSGLPKVEINRLFSAQKWKFKKKNVFFPWLLLIHFSGRPLRESASWNIKNIGLWDAASSTRNVISFLPRVYTSHLFPSEKLLISFVDYNF